MPQGRTKRRRESKTIKSCERIPPGGYYSNSFSCMLARSLRESVIQIRANISRVPRNIRTCVANIITAGPVRPFATSCSKGSLEISIPDDRCVRYSHPARAVHISRRFPASECIRDGRLPFPLSNETRPTTRSMAEGVPALFLSSLSPLHRFIHPSSVLSLVQPSFPARSYSLNL